MKRIFQVLIVAICFPGVASGQFEFRTLGSRSASLGGSHAALARDIWSSFVNPALLTSFRDVSVSFAVVPFRFGLDELQSTAVAVQFPVNRLKTGIAIQRYGFQLYNETTASFAAASRISDRLSVGAVVNWYHLSIEGYGNAGVPGLSIGIEFSPAPNFSAGVCILNINRPAIGESSNPLPSIFLAGFQYRPHALFLLSGELKKDILMPAEISIGLETIITENFGIRAGFAERTASASGGFSLRVSRMNFDYALAWHAILGRTHYFTLSVDFGRRRVYRDVPVPGEMKPVSSPELSAPEMLSLGTIKSKLADPPPEDEFVVLRFLNNATRSDLILLPGIGPVIADRILEFRERMGPFTSHEELLEVRGIGKSILLSIVGYLESRPER